MRILVTGGNGFLGKHVLENFNLYQNITVLSPSSKELDLTDLSSVMTYFEYQRPDKVLHMSAICGGILANKNSPADFLHLNVKMASNIFDAVYKYNTKYIYTLGSVCAYPKYCPVPFNENDIWNGYPEETNAPYGMAKRFQLSMQQAFRQQYGVKGAHFIPVNMYGEEDHFDLTNSHVIPALIRKFIAAIDINDSEVYCWGTGEATREFLYAGDCAELLTQAVIDEFDTDLPINVGTGKSISIKELAETIGRLCGFKGKIVFTGEVSDGQPKRQLNVSRAKQQLGFEAKTALITGLVRTISWYQENKHLLKD